MNKLLFLLVVFLVYINNVIFNLSKQQVIIGSLIVYYFLFIQKENFALTTSGANAIIINKNDLVNTQSYVTGTLDPTKQVVTVSEAINGGASCVPFPTTVYRLAQPSPAQCRSGTTTFTGGQEASIQANVDSNYNFGSTPTIGSSLKI